MHEARLPINCVEGWSVGADWRGLSLLEVVLQAGGTADSRIQLISIEQNWGFNHSFVEGPQLSAALLATHLNGQRLDIDHGYPLRLISPNPAGVLNTRWLGRIDCAPRSTEHGRCRRSTWSGHRPHRVVIVRIRAMKALTVHEFRTIDRGNGALTQASPTPAVGVHLSQPDSRRRRTRQA